MTNLQLLLGTLKYHGFHTAAADLEIPSRDIDASLATWADYPGCMDKFAKQIRLTKVHYK